MFGKIVKRGLLGFMIGVFIGQTILILNSLLAGKGIYYPINPLMIDIEGPQLSRVIIQYFLTGVIGTTFAACSVIFEMDKWSILKQTLIHFVIVSVVMYFCGFICNWFEHNVKSTLIWFGIFLSYYILFWFGFTIYYKVQVKKMNKQIEK